MENQTKGAKRLVDSVDQLTLLLLLFGRLVALVENCMLCALEKL